MVYVFDMGGTLMEYQGMPLCWSGYYEEGFRAIDRQYHCEASEEEIRRSAAILQAWNPRSTGRQEELTPGFLFEKALAPWRKKPPLLACAPVFFSGIQLRAVIYPDSLQCLQELRRRGHQTAVLTDLPNAMPDELFQAAVSDLLPLVDYYLSSAISGVRKPNGRGLEMIARHFSVPMEELVFLGDEEKDRQTAENAGCRFVEVRRNGQEDFNLWRLLQRRILVAHTMQYTGGEPVSSDWRLRTYSDADYPAYRTAYNDCFSDMRRALHLSPVHCCSDRAELLAKAKDIFILEAAGELAGSVAIYGNEIDDLFVRKDFQGKGYGQGLLRFAVARMQRGGISPITLHVADWNQSAVRLYERNGFRITATEVV